MAILSKLHRSGIVTNYIDCYCLVCNTHLKSEKDAFSHILISTHLKNLESTTYEDKYKDEYIRKIKTIYFCECCNLILRNKSKAGLHTQDSNHSANKINQILQRDGSTIIAFENLVIDEKAWNSFIGDTCNVCDENFENEENHKHEETHMLNLMQSKIECSLDKNVFRKIDDQTLQCLTCNELLNSTTTKNHCENAAHKKKYADSQKINKPNNIQQQTASTNQPLFKSGFLNMNNNNNNKKASTVSKPLETPKTTEKENVKPVKDTEVNIINNVTNKQYIDIENEICKVLNAENYIVDDENGQKWCILCDWTINPDGVPLHLSGKHHETLLSLNKKRMERKSKLLEAANEVSATKQVNKVENSKITKIENEYSNESAVILDSLERYQKYDINVNFVSNRVTCRKCSESIGFNHLSIDKHIQDHKKKDLEDYVHEQVAKGNIEKPKDESKPTLVKEKAAFKKLFSNIPQETVKTVATLVKEKPASKKKPFSNIKPINKEAEQFAKDNDLVITNMNKAFCKICNTKVPCSVNNMQEHLNGMHHRSRLTKTERREKLIVTKTRCLDFVMSVIACELLVFKDFVVNEKYVINVNSFQAIARLSIDYTCYVCDVDIAENEYDLHVNLKTHKEALENSMVITSKPDEFIREVRPETYHCGFCNTIFDCSELGSHLRTLEHLESARNADWRLHYVYRSVLREQKPNLVKDVFASVKQAFY